MITPGMYTQDKKDWETPQWLYDLLDRQYHFHLDPCATDETAKCDRWFTKADNGLKRAWFGSVYVNPPYGREIGDWLARAAHQIRYKRVERIVMLLPARTDTKWWHRYVMGHAKEIRFIEGRLKFQGGSTSAPFPSVIAIFDRRLCPLRIGPTIKARGRK